MTAAGTSCLTGVLVVTPSPFVHHQRTVRDLLALLHAACPDDLEVFGAPLDVRLSERTVGEPDLLLKRERYEAAGVGSYWVVDPVTRDLVVRELRDGRYEEVHHTALNDELVVLSRPFPVVLDLRASR